MSALGQGHQLGLAARVCSQRDDQIVGTAGDPPGITTAESLLDSRIRPVRTHNQSRHADGWDAKNPYRSHGVTARGGFGLSHGIDGFHGFSPTNQQNSDQEGQDHEAAAL
jgi:hypothetical protein